MCSCEPILGSFKGYDFSQFEFVVIGELDGKGNYKNYRTVRHKKIYYKR
jgi:protein gp37